MPVWLTWNALKGLPWHLIGIVAAVAVVGAYIAILHMDLRHVTEQRDGYQAQIVQLQTDVKAKTAQALADDTAHARTVETAQDAVSTKTGADYETQLAAIRSDYDRRLRSASAAHPGSSGATRVSGIPATASISNGAEQCPRITLQDARDADEAIARLDGLQAWVSGQVAVKRDNQ